MPKSVRKLSSCQNCQRALDTENFCPDCGQKNISTILPVKELLREFLGNYVTVFDSKSVRSMAALLRPGRLTMEYVDGKRARYVSPIRLYLFFSLVFFLVPSSDEPDEPANVEPAAATVTELDATRNPGISSDTELRDRIERELDERGYAAGTTSRRIARRMRLGFAVDELSPQQFDREVERRIPMMLFGLVPLFALFVQLALRRSRPLYVVCFVYALHCHAFAFLSLTVAKMLVHVSASAGQGYIGGLLDSLFTFAIFAYLVVALARVFEISWMGAIFKSFVITLAHSVALAVGVLLTIAISAIALG